MSDTNVTGSAVETPSAPTTSGQSAPAAATPAAPASQSATQTESQAPATGVPSGYIPSYRAREIREQVQREADQRFQAEQARWHSELERVQAQVRALTGVAPTVNPEVDQIKSRFGEIFPGVSRLEENAEAIQQLLERAQDYEAQQTHYWQSYGRQSMDRLFGLAEGSLGVPLTDSGKSQLHSAFVGYVQSSPERTSRYQNDPTIVQDFWQEFTSSLIDPVRRSSQATVQQRAAGVPVPQDSPSGAVPTSRPAPKFDNLDDRIKAGWTQFTQLRGPRSDVS